MATNNIDPDAGPQPGPFDNDISMLYRWAVYEATPTKYMLVIEDGNRKSYQPIIAFIQQLLAENPDQPYIDIYHAITEHLPLLAPSDLPLLIFAAVLETALENNPGLQSSSNS